MVASLLCALSGALGADVVHLRSGRTLEGDVSYEDDKVVVATRFGTVTFRRDEVLRVEKVATPEEQYRKRAQALAAFDAHGHYQLALWCREHDLEEQARREARAALAADPEHEGANRLLGHVRFEGRWVTPADRDSALAGAARSRIEAALGACRSALADAGDPALAGRVSQIDRLCAGLTAEVALNVGEFAEKLPSGSLSAPEGAELLTLLQDLLAVAGKVSVSDLKDASHLAQARQLIADYFRAASAGEEAGALAQLEALQDVSPEVVSALAQEGPWYGPQPTGEQTRTVTVGGDRIEYALAVPHDYDPRRAHPLLLACHGIGSWGSEFVSRWRGPCLERGYLLACPTDPYAGRGYGARPGERALVLATIEDVARSYHVDPDRVFLTGLSAGGHGAWDVGLHHADRFAGLVPESGMPVHEGWPITSYLYLQNASSGPAVLALVGERDTAVRSVCQQAVEHLQALGGDAALVVAGTEHGAYSSENDRVFAWMAERRRDPVPTTLFNRIHHLDQGRSFWVEVTALAGEEWDASKPVKLKGTYDSNLSKEEQLELARAQLAGDLPTVRASVGEGNVVKVTTAGVARMTVWLSPKLVDFARPLELVVNGRTLWKGQVRADVGVLLGEMKRSGDLGRVYLGGLGCDLSAKSARARGRDER